jgi:hypothetical protein
MDSSALGISAASALSDGAAVAVGAKRKRGAPLALRALSADGPTLPLCSGVALCAPRVMRDELAALQAPVLCLFDRTHARDDALAASARTFLDAAAAALLTAAHAAAIVASAHGDRGTSPPEPLDAARNCDCGSRREGSA